MNPGKLERLAALLGAVAEAERLRLAALSSTSGTCRRMAAELRQRSREAPGGGSGRLGPGELVALAAWGRRLARLAHDAEKRAAVLDAEVQVLRTRYAQSFARAQAIARLAHRITRDQRRQSALRSESMVVPLAPAQWSGAAPPSARPADGQSSSGAAGGPLPAASGAALPGSPAIT